MLLQLDFSSLKSTTENQLKSNMGKHFKTVWFGQCYKGYCYMPKDKGSQQPEVEVVQFEFNFY